ncbi:YkgJ family cysteine cluster protein [Frateuria edaphi]|uniref:YkgJ family cysteine cluster protein n=1 Tax=Frateuria TaxID=70411 RepID=UPI001E5F66A6|nr:YkgJ family cysteine cluster protein [Frateuria edaphi]UGB46437.1 YkgJ family cysteine cluster protein [Frateuria edaphi]
MNDDFEDDRYATSVDPSVQCTACDAVCCRLTVVLMPEDDVPDWLVTRDDHGLATLAKGEDGWCAAVDPNTSRCTIYEQRPSICRKYAMGSPGCRDERRKWYGPSVPTPVKLL